ncbi:MAG: Uncharacterized protein G01um10143_289 [Parcubacteria group bacterium Gr01-1014_3]|nr:MAG: Uncharacterized protein G01um10143_289 [Parcubacteria group bacterium Gr01-1014_3]
MKKFLLGLMMVSVLLAPALAFAQEKTPECQSGWILCGLMQFFNWGSLAVGNMIGIVAGFLISIASSLIGVLINLGPQITSSPLVREGFRLTLSMTNLGFVIAIIVIAFATMLRLQNYGFKQMIWKLVAAALLVNFSFTFAGIIIDFFNVFGNYFIQAASPENINNFAANLAQSLNVSSLSGIKIAVPENISGDILKFGLSYISAFVSVASTAIFMTTLVITFFAIAFMLLVRYIYLIFLLIVMPLAWLAWIFPNLAKHSSEWWSTFLKWNVFFPAISFFLYLSILTSDKLGAVLKSQASPEAFAAAKTISGLSEGVLIGFLQIIVQVGMMFAGLIVAQKLGAVGANTAMGMANSAKGWIIGATGKAARLPLTGARAGAQELGTRPAKAGANALANLLNTKALRWIPGSKAAVAGLNVAASRSNEVGDYQKQYLSSLTEQQFAERQKTTRIERISPVEQAALLAESVKRKEVGGLTAHLATSEEKDARLEQFIQASRKVNPGIADTEEIVDGKKIRKNIENVPNVKDALSTSPRLTAKLTGKTLKQIAEKMRADKAADVEKEMFNEVDFVLGLSQAAISDIYRRGTILQRSALKKTMEKEIGADLRKINEDIALTLKQITEAKEVGDKSKVSTLQSILKVYRADEKTKLTAGSDTQKIAYKKLKFAQQTIGDDE